jgi:hypothetical protein
MRRIADQHHMSAVPWRRAILEAPPPYTAPPWAKFKRYPFLEPWVDFVSQFLLEAPTDDFKRYLRPYLTTACYRAQIWAGLRRSTRNIGRVRILILPRWVAPEGSGAVRSSRRTLEHQSALRDSRD